MAHGRMVNGYRTTTGLAIDSCGDDAPEQVYVYRADDEGRPICVDGWVGWAVPMKMRLTTRQAAELVVILTKQLVEGDPE